jgi:DNA polymerase elongation subunit (family B)
LLFRKGIDIVRRDWSEISKEAGKQVLDLILDINKDKDNL